MGLAAVTAHRWLGASTLTLLLSWMGSVVFFHRSHLDNRFAAAFCTLAPLLSIVRTFGKDFQIGADLFGKRGRPC